MQKKFNFRIVIQTAAIGWDGAKDMSLSLVNNKPVLYWVIKKCIKNWPNTKIVIIAPIKDRNSEIANIVKQFPSNQVALIWGKNDDVLSRLISASKNLDDKDYILRILGLHYFFDSNIANRLLDHVKNDRCSFAKAPDNFEIQLTCEVIRIDCLRLLKNYVQTKQLKNTATILVSPVHYITSSAFKKSGHVLNELPYPDPKQKKKMRKIALSIYNIDRTEVDLRMASQNGSQLTFHYELAKNYLPKHAVVLDVACGEGFGTKLLASKCKTIIGADIDKDAINQAFKENTSSNCFYIRANANDLPFPDNSFNCVISMETLEHVDENLFLSEVKRILKPKGVLILSTPQNINGEYPINPFHNKEYSINQITKLIGRYFTIKHLIGIKTGRLIIKGDAIGTNTFIVAYKNEYKS